MRSTQLSAIQGRLTALSEAAHQTGSEFATKAGRDSYTRGLKDALDTVRQVEAESLTQRPRCTMHDLVSAIDQHAQVLERGFEMLAQIADHGR